MKYIDAHIHLDLYNQQRAAELINVLPEQGAAGLIAVSTNLSSCVLNERWAKLYPKQVFPAYGLHPEQPPLQSNELIALIGWIRSRSDQMYAVGEIGLPYYQRKEARKRNEPFDMEPYIRQLNLLLQLAEELAKPAVLHAVYEDAELACDLLDRYPQVRAHFHWFKGSDEVIGRMIKRRHFVSITPDVLYKEKIEDLVRRYPLDLLMVETDGPWPFEGPFAGRETSPWMIRNSIQAIAQLKGLPELEVSTVLYNNTVQFYGLPLPLQRLKDSKANETRLP